MSFELGERGQRESPLDDKSAIATVQPVFNRDEAVLARFGKRQQLKRRFGLLPAIGITTTLMITWESIASTLLLGFVDGGPAGLIYSYLFVWAGAILQTLVVAELASMIPLAGGPFNWVAILSPPWCRKFLSYLTGWMTMISYLALVTANCYVAGTMVQGLLILNDPTYDFQRWHGTLLFYAALAISLFANTYLGRFLPQIESLILFFHVAGFFATIIPVVHLSPHRSAYEVFTTFLNLGEWRTTPLAFFVGLVTCTNAFPGLDAADHIAEEIEDAPRVIPLSVGASVLLNGTLGFAMLLALLFCMPADVTSILDSETSYPFISIYTNAVGSNAGATALTSIIVCTQVFGAIGEVATTSRMIWAFAREGGLPFSNYLSRVDEKTRLPLWAIGTTAVIALLLALINIGSSVGFASFISLIVAGYYSSFVLAAAVMLNKRLTSPSSEIPWGPFRLGKAGVPITILAIGFSLIGGFFSFWPVNASVTLESMNYCMLVYGAFVIFSIAFWFLNGRKRYTGPIAEIVE